MELNTAAICKMAQVKPETLRTWERRYNALTPARDASGRRIYGQDDLNRLKMLAILVRSGHAIGRVAGLSNLELTELVPNDNLTFTNSPTDFQDIIDSVDQFDLVEIQRQLGLILRAHSPLEAYEDVICPLLHEVGSRWQGGDLTVGQEHAISAVIIQLLSSFPTRAHGKGLKNPVIFSTLEREIHEIGSSDGRPYRIGQWISGHQSGPQYAGGSIG